MTSKRLHGLKKFKKDYKKRPKPHMRRQPINSEPQVSGISAVSRRLRSLVHTQPKTYRLDSAEILEDLVCSLNQFLLNAFFCASSPEDPGPDTRNPPKQFPPRPTLPFKTSLPRGNITEISILAHVCELLEQGCLTPQRLLPAYWDMCLPLSLIASFVHRAF